MPVMDTIIEQQWFLMARQCIEAYGLQIGRITSAYRIEEKNRRLHPLFWRRTIQPHFLKFKDFKA